MKTIVKVYKSDCEPCKSVSQALTELAKEEEFKLEEYNIESTEFKERKIGKSLMMKWGTINIPLVLFLNEEGDTYAAHYYESGAVDKELLKQKLNEN